MASPDLIKDCCGYGLAANCLNHSSAEWAVKSVVTLSGNREAVESEWSLKHVVFQSIAIGSATAKRCNVNSLPQFNGLQTNRQPRSG
jgi:hypothetical protein